MDDLAICNSSTFNLSISQEKNKIMVMLTLYPGAQPQQMLFL